MDLVYGVEVRHESNASPLSSSNHLLASKMFPRQKVILKLQYKKGGLWPLAVFALTPPWYEGTIPVKSAYQPVT
jgi:hypothetical protein